MELREIKKKLWNSVDAQFHRRTLTVCAGVLAFFWAILALLWRITPGTAVLMAGMANVVVIPLLMWRSWKLISIFRHAEQYLFFRTTLSAPKGNRKAVAFPITVPGGAQCWTDKIFYIRNIQPLLSEWLDKTATVAWNRETGRVIVIGK